MSIIESILGSVVVKAAARVIEQVLDYCDLPNFGKGVLRRLSMGKEIVIAAYSQDNAPGDQYFWKAVIEGSIGVGDSITLKHFQVSPWFPRKPGTYWTQEAGRARQIAHERHIEKRNSGGIIFDLYGKALMAELGGVGTVCLKKDRNEVLVTVSASGKTHQGIPIISSQKIWEELHRALRTGKMLEIDLRGILVQIPSDYDSTVLRAPGVPRVAVKIDSLLDMKQMISRVPIIVTPWTIFESDDTREPFGFTYVTHQLNVDDMNGSVAWLQNYIMDHGGKSVVTDFDEETNPLNARFPLGHCFEGVVSQKQVLEYCQSVNARFSRYH